MPGPIGLYIEAGVSRSKSVTAIHTTTERTKISLTLSRAGLLLILVDYLLISKKTPGPSKHCAFCHGNPAAQLGKMESHCCSNERARLSHLCYTFVKVDVDNEIHRSVPLPRERQRLNNQHEVAKLGYPSQHPSASPPRSQLEEDHSLFQVVIGRGTQNWPGWPHGP